MDGTFTQTTLACIRWTHVTHLVGNRQSGCKESGPLIMSPPTLLTFIATTGRWCLQACERPMEEAGERLVQGVQTEDKGQFSKLLAKLYQMLKPQLAVSGFAKCGIYPFVIAADKLAPAATFDRDLPVPTSDSTSGDMQQSTSNATPGENIPNTPLKEPTAGWSTQSCESTLRTAMKQAVMAQLKVCNAAVRRKTSKRRIAKQFGGECLTEEEGVKRLTESIERKKSKQSKRVIAKHVSIKKIRKAKKSKSTRKTSRFTVSDDLVSDQDISDTPNDVEPDESETDSNSNTTSAQLGPRRSLQKIIVGDYVKVRYESEFYPAEVTAIVDKKYKCNCMMALKSGWKWPAKRDEIWYDAADVIKKIGQPIPVSSRGAYKFADF